MRERCILYIYDVYFNTLEVTNIIYYINIYKYRVCVVMRKRERECICEKEREKVCLCVIEQEEREREISALLYVEKKKTISKEK